MISGPASFPPDPEFSGWTYVLVRAVLFLLQRHEGRLYLLRSPDVTTGLTEEDRQGTWYLIRADFPADAIAHARAVIAGQCDLEDQSCGQCAAEAVGTGTWQEMINLAASTVTSRHPADMKVPSIRAWPRYFEIPGGC